MHSRRTTAFPSPWRLAPVLLVALSTFLLAGLGARPAEAIEGPGTFEPPRDAAWMFDEPSAPKTYRRILTTDIPLAIPQCPAGDILLSWLGAHNQASAEALRFWLRASLNPSISDDDVDKRLGWYVEATTTFGPLSPEPLAVLENEPHRLLVHLVRSDLAVRERLNPMNIVVVEVDIDANDPRYLRRGLALGSLAGEVPESDGD